ncbi:MAG: GIY-YIG nuclease family protein [Chloroflexota bacterium]|nr:GIY-YIG nuclease family protein [Chloroflexota bacterium]
MTIRLTDIWAIPEPSRYKLHFARFNRIDQPLDVFVRSRAEWQGWQEFRPRSDQFNRPFVFSVIDFYREPDIWLFGGVWEVVERLPDRYVVSLTDQGRDFIGRLKLHSPYRQRGTRVNFEKRMDEFTVSEVLREEYSGLEFPGHDRIDIGFGELEALIRNGRADWRGALENAKGVYLIADTGTGRLYVGAAYGEGGIWSRWREYVETGHGGNVRLRELLEDRDLDYCQTHFRFSLLESHSVRIADDAIIERETYWKGVLHSRGKLGFNS